MYRRGFTLLEIVPVLSIVAFLATVVILALNPAKQYQEARNVIREQDVTLIADAIASYTKDYGTSLFYSIPTATSKEICGDTSPTRVCLGLLDLNTLNGTYLDGVPTDPLVDKGSVKSGYFVIRSGSRFTVSAPNTEPAGAEDLSVTR